MMSRLQSVKLPGRRPATKLDVLFAFCTTYLVYVIGNLAVAAGNFVAATCRF